MPYDGILLDLDNTLYDYEKAHRPALETTINWLASRLYLSMQAVEQNYYLARKQINLELAGQAASHSRVLYFQRTCELLGSPDWILSGEAEDRYWNTFLDQLEPRPGLFEFLERVSEKRIVVITDLTARIQLRKIERLGLAKRIHALVSSEEAGVEKPHRRIFELALQKLKLPVDVVCMIGDSSAKDIQGALNMGIKAFQLNPGGGAPDTSGQLGNNHAVVQFEQFEELLAVFE